ncbi:MAG: hypothetical protein ACRC50_04370 [Gaiella sp.]
MTSGSSILSAVLDRDAIARARRRRELEEALVDETERELALREQVEAIVLEAEGPRIDAALRAALSPEDVDVLAEVLAGDDAATAEAAWEDEWELEVEPLDLDAALARLGAEIDACAARRDALTRAIALLEHPLERPLSTPATETGS